MLKTGLEPLVSAGLSVIRHRGGVWGERRGHTDPHEHDRVQFVSNPWGRAVGVALWLAAFMGPQTFPPLMSYVESTFGTPAGAFWIYSAVCVFAVFFG